MEQDNITRDDVSTIMEIMQQRIIVLGNKIELTTSEERKQEYSLRKTKLEKLYIKLNKTLLLL